MQANELKGRAVVVLSNAEKVGQVEDVLFDAPFRQVLGFRAQERRPAWPRLRRSREKALRPLALTR